MNQVFLGAGAVVLAALLWSLDGLLRVHLYSLPPTVIVFWEHMFGLLVILPFVVSSLSSFKALTKKQWLSIGLVALLSGALGTVLYTAALGRVHYIQFSVVVLLQKLQPIFAILAGAWLLKEPVTKRFIGLAVLALVSAYIVSFPDLRVALTPGSPMVIAALLAFGAAVCWGTSTAFSKYSLQGVSFLHVTAARFALTPVFALLMTVGLGKTALLPALTAPQWSYIIAITFSTGLIALAIYYYGLQRVPASRSSLLELTWPLSSIFIGYFFLGDHLTATQWLAVPVLLFSIVAISYEAKQVVPVVDAPAVPLPL